MNVVVLNTGTELLLGDVLNTHLVFIAREIFPLGLRVAKQTTVPDGEAIGAALREAFSQAEIVFVTGGLGPTTDDVTREIVAEQLALSLKENEEIAKKIRARLRARRIPLTDRILRQAAVPNDAVILPNDNGTAPGLYLRAGINSAVASPHLFLLPGPPRELQPMFAESVLPILAKVAPASDITCRNYRIAGIGESIVERAVGKKLLEIPGLELGYCARVGEVDLRVIGNDAAIAQADQIVWGELSASIFSTARESLESVLVRKLAKGNETLATAESCTGGLIAHRLTNVPGASAVFQAGFVTYSNESKVAAPDVPAALIESDGAVSENVARAMAEGARLRAKTTFALATTGVAGPTGGTQSKPVGTVFIALAKPDETLVRQFFFPGDRETFKQMASQSALNLLREALR